MIKQISGLWSSCDFLWGIPRREINRSPNEASWVEEQTHPWTVSYHENCSLQQEYMFVIALAILWCLQEITGVLVQNINHRPSHSTIRKVSTWVRIWCIVAHKMLFSTKQVLIVFLILHENILWILIRSAQWGNSNKYPQHSFCVEIKKQFLIPHLICLLSDWPFFDALL